VVADEVARGGTQLSSKDGLHDFTVDELDAHVAEEGATAAGGFRCAAPSVAPCGPGATTSPKPPTVPTPSTSSDRGARTWWCSTC
jgi:hypothetical protein